MREWFTAGDSDMTGTIDSDLVQNIGDGNLLTVVERKRKGRPARASEQFVRALRPSVFPADPQERREDARCLCG